MTSVYGLGVGPEGAGEVGNDVGSDPQSRVSPSDGMVKLKRFVVLEPPKRTL